MRVDKVKQKIKLILLAIIFVGVGMIGSKLYNAKNYVMIERTQAESFSQNEVKGDEEYITLNKQDFGQFTMFFEAYKEITQNHLEKIETKDLVDGAISGMTEATGDVFTSFTPINEEEESVANSLSSRYKGIGAEVTLIDGYAVITNPFKNAPAYEAGVLAYDRIQKVDGEDVVGFDLAKIVTMIKGEKGTDVVLTLIRGSLEPFDLTIKRDEIVMETVFQEVIQEGNKKIGKIEIASFAEDTSKDFQKALNTLEKESIQGLIIDVRDNGGGYLQAVKKIASELLPINKVILKMEDNKGDQNVVKSNSLLKNPKEYPVVVLVNGRSASASEVLAGALKESGDYTLVGEKTFGKGTVQELNQLSDNSELKITVAKWLTPNGTWIHEKGIEPDVDIKQPSVFLVPGIQMNELELSIGDVSSEILYAQELLKLLGYEINELKGYFGEETEKVMKQFQLDEEIESTGKMDKETLFRLNELLLKAKKDPKYDNQLKEGIKILTES